MGITAGPDIENGLLLQFVDRTPYYSKGNAYNVAVLQSNMNNENICCIIR